MTVATQLYTHVQNILAHIQTEIETNRVIALNKNTGFPRYLRRSRPENIPP